MTTSTTTKAPDKWTRMLGSYGTSKEACDQVRRLWKDPRRKGQEFQVNRDDTGQWVIEFRRKW